MQLTKWWQQAVVYQLYVRSFNDLDGDGVGDLAGIAERLDYLAALGVDAIWLNPCYPSPNNDGGYDVADYTGIDPVYGGLPAFDKLLTAAHERGLRVLMDLVPNHCSDQHPWFQQALAAAPGSPERARFHFRDGRGQDGSQPPNNWRSTFSGSAWTRVTGADGRPQQWYLHSFDSSQPDFNWANPEVPELFDDVLRTWFDRDVDGFRIDVAYAMVKHPDLPDLDDPQHNPYSWNQPGVHEIFARWRAIADSYHRDIPLIGEVWLTPQEAADYIRPGRLDQVFYFDLMLQPWNANAFRESIAATIASIPADGGVAAWTLNNHDVHRSVSRYGLTEAQPMDTDDAHARLTRARGSVDVDLGIRRARAAALLLLALPGARCLYQGEELGLPEVLDLPGDARRDPIWSRSKGQQYGRDGSRVPLPWAAQAPGFGFSPAGSSAPWLPQPDWFANFAVSTQDGVADSTLTLYRAALRVRRNLFTGNGIRWLETGNPEIVAFARDIGISVTNMSDAPFPVPEAWGEFVVRTAAGVDRELAPGTGAWLTTGA